MSAASLKPQIWIPGQVLKPTPSCLLSTTPLLREDRLLWGWSQQPWSLLHIHTPPDRK